MLNFSRTKLNRHVLRAVFLFLPALAMLVSCGPERMIGDYYIKKSPKGSILLIRPELIYKNNLMRFDLSDQMSETQKDSVAYYRSAYMQYVSDSAFLAEYLNTFIDRLLTAGFDVYAQESLDSFNRAQPPSYIVKVAQLQLEESRDTSDYETEGGTDGDGNYYSNSLLLNTVRLNSWFEVTELHADSSKVKKLFFASSRAHDAVKGGMYLMSQSGELQYHYSIDTLTLNDVYDLARQSGKAYGEYLIDYLMNEYIRIQMPDGMIPQRYMHYDPALHRVRDSHGEGFQELAPGK